jgi:hypothetical protein
LRSLRKRVEALEDMAEDLNHITTPPEVLYTNTKEESNKEINNKPNSIIEFQTLKIIKDICDRELVQTSEETEEITDAASTTSELVSSQIFHFCLNCLKARNNAKTNAIKSFYAFLLCGGRKVRFRNES